MDRTHTSRPLVANHALHRHLERLQASSIYHQNLRNNHTDHKSLKHIGVHRSSLADQSNNCTKFDSKFANRSRLRIFHVTMNLL